MTGRKLAVALLAAVAVLAVDQTPAAAQDPSAEWVVVPGPQPGPTEWVYTPARRGLFGRIRRPAKTPVYAGDRGVLPGFSSAGGIGTTPYLGNTHGLGAYSTNYGLGRVPTRPYYISRWRTR